MNISRAVLWALLLGLPAAAPADFCSTVRQGADCSGAQAWQDLDVRFATAAQGVLAASAVQPEDIDSLSELNALLADATLVDTTDPRFSDSRDASSFMGVAIDATGGSPTDGKIWVYRTVGTDWVLEDKPAAGANPAAADVSVSATPTNYTAGTADVEAHLAGIDGALGSVGGGAVDSVFSRTGVVVAALGDYDASQISETAGEKIMTAAERTKLAGIAESATIDQTGAEIEGLLDTELSNTDWKKATGTSAGTVAEGDHGHAGVYEPAGVAPSDIVGSTADGQALMVATDANPFTDADESKLDGVAAGAEVNVQSDWSAGSGDAQILNKPSIPTALADLDTTVTGAQLDADHSKLAGVADNATADQTDAEIETAYNNQVGQISAGEITAGTETAVRRFAPDDVKSMIDTHGGGGATDHGALTGLADDDHTQYHNDTRGDARYVQPSEILSLGTVTSGKICSATGAAELSCTTDNTANGLSLLGAADYAAMRTLLSLEAGTDFYSISAADAAFSPIAGSSSMVILGAGAVDAITEIDATLKTGIAAKLVTGLAGTAGNCPEYDANGDLVDSGDVCGGTGGGTATGLSLTENGDANGFDIVDVDKLQGLDAALFVDMGADGVTQIAGDAIQLDVGATVETLEFTVPSANVVDIGSDTGATRLSSDLEFATTGSLMGGVNIVKKSATYIVGTDDALESYGTLFVNTNNTGIDFTLDTAVAGKAMCFANDTNTAGDITVQPASGDYLVPDTRVPLTVATDFTSGNEAEAFICVVAVDDTYWLITRLDGTWSE